MKYSVSVIAMLLVVTFIPASGQMPIKHATACPVSLIHLSNGRVVSDALELWWLAKQAKSTATGYIPLSKGDNPNGFAALPARASLLVCGFSGIPQPAAGHPVSYNISPFGPPKNQGSGNSSSPPRSDLYNLYLTNGTSPIVTCQINDDEWRIWWDHFVDATYVRVEGVYLPTGEPNLIRACPKRS